MDFNLEPTPIMSTSGSIPNRPPGENDVIVGAGCNKHCGNLKFQQFIKAYKRARFRTNPKIETQEAVKEVCEFWRKLSPRGRFLAQKKGSNDGKWHEVDDRQAMRIASFFLLNQKGGELKRQKSIDAMKTNRNAMNGPPLVRSQSGPVPRVSRGSALGTNLMGSVKGGQAQMPGQGQQGQVPDMASLEPVPIGSTSSTSMAWEPQHQKQHSQRMSFQEPSKSNCPDKDQHCDAFDFNPLPFKSDNETNDDFEPIQANLNNSFASGKKSLDVSTNAQFAGAPEQVQVSVNMVVNTMPPGFPSENTVNTVTNIQIGTGSINDERKKPSKPNFNPGQNFQLQISAQSNPNGTDDRCTMKPGFSQAQMNNNFQVGFFGSQGDGAANMLGQGNGSGFNTNNGTSGNGNMMGNNAMQMQMINGNMMGNMVNNNLAGLNHSMNNSSAINRNGNGQNNALRWNKNEVANSVPDAASLVGSVFDDW